MAPNDSKQRIHWLDVSRGLCIIAIVIGHVFTNGYIRWYLYSFHVPAFFYLSGLCFKENENLKIYLTKRIKTIVIPYLFFSIVSIIIFWFSGRFIDSLKEVASNSLFDSVLEMLYGNSKPEKMRYNLPLWFLPCFFSSSVIVFFEERLSEKTSIIIRFCFIIICIILGCYFSQNEEIALPWHIETAVSMSVWYILGIISQKIFLRKNYLNEKSLWLIGFFGVVMGGLFSFMNNRIVGVRNEHYGIIPIYYLSALGSVLGIVTICKAIEHCSFLEKIGRCSLSILVLHKFPILIFQKAIPFTRLALSNPNSIIGVLVGLSISAISIALSYIGWSILIRSIPWSVGVYNKNQEKN